MKLPIRVQVFYSGCIIRSHSCHRQLHWGRNSSNVGKWALAMTKIVMCLSRPPNRTSLLMGLGCVSSSKTFRYPEITFSWVLKMVGTLYFPGFLSYFPSFFVLPSSPGDGLNQLVLPLVAHLCKLLHVTWWDPLWHGSFCSSIWCGELCTHPIPNSLCLWTFSFMHTYPTCFHRGSGSWCCWRRITPCVRHTWRSSSWSRRGSLSTYTSVE